MFLYTRLVVWVIFISFPVFWAWDPYVELKPYNYDGSGVNENGEGSAGEPFLKKAEYTAFDYDNLPSARQVLQNLYLSGTPLLSHLGASQAIAYWGLLLLHDLVDTIPTDVEFNIPCDDGVSDSMCFDADSEVLYYRVEVDPDTGVPLNAATAFHDLDCIYGRSEEEVGKLRTFESGLMQLTDQNLPLFELDPDTGIEQFLIADQRMAELPGTFALNVLLLRHHNLQATILNNATYLAELQETYRCTPIPCTEWGDEELFQGARSLTIAAAQHVTNDEYLPKLLSLASSENITGDYDDTYDKGVEYLASIALRWPYFALGPVDRFMNASWHPNQQFDLLPVGSVCNSNDLYDIVQSTGIDGILRGMMFADGANIDAYLPLRSATSCLDAPVFDIQAGRDFGLPSYNDVRISLGLAPATSFEDITTDVTVADELEKLYVDVDMVDMLVGCLVETKTDESLYFGSLLWNILYNFLSTVKKSDPYWHVHENILGDARTMSLSYLASLNPDPVGAFSSSEVEEVVTVYPTDAFSAIRYAPPENVTISQSIIFVEGVYELSWEIDEDSDTITFTATVTGMGTSGYFAVGLGSKMAYADVFAFVEIQDDVVSITDRYGVENLEPTLDTENDEGTESTTYISREITSETNQFVVVFSRSLEADSSDIYDISISDEDMSIIWSYNLEDVAQHGFSNRGINIVNFYSGLNTVVSSTDAESFFFLHGLVMIIAWGICGPLAFYVVRYQKHWKYWLDVHEALATFAMEASLPLIFAAIASAGGEIRSTHGQIGLILLVVILVQFFSGKVRKAGIMNYGNNYFGTNYDRLHQVNKVFHRLFGKCVVVLALINVIIGLKIASPDDSTLVFTGLATASTSALQVEIPELIIVEAYVFPAFLCMTAMAFLFAEFYHFSKRQTHHKRMNEKFDGLPSYTMEQFNNKVLQGEKWVLVNDAIIDVAQFVKAHPGGSKVLKDSVGTNITREILGARGVGQGLNNTAHVHSGKAWLAMREMVVAYVYESNESTAGEKNSRPGSTVENPKHLKRHNSLAEQPFVKYILRSKTVIADDMRGSPVLSLVLEPKEEKLCPTPFNFGYYHKFRVVSGDNVVQRSYTPINQPLLQPDTYGFEYYIRLQKGGQMSTVLGQMKINDSIRVQGPCNVKEMQKKYNDIYLIAGGTGVTPMLQYIRGQINRQREKSIRNDNVSVEEMNRNRSLATAQKISLLWQTHSNRDSFCLRDLDNFVNESKAITHRDLSAGIDFYYTNYILNHEIIAPIRQNQINQYSDQRRSSVSNQAQSVEENGNWNAKDYIGSIPENSDENDPIQKKSMFQRLSSGFSSKMFRMKAKHTNVVGSLPSHGAPIENEHPVMVNQHELKLKISLDPTQVNSFRENFQAAAGLDRLIPRNEMVQGKISTESLEIHLAPLLHELTLPLNSIQHSGIIISGPPGFVDGIEANLINLGIPEALIHCID